MKPTTLAALALGLAAVAVPGRASADDYPSSDKDTALERAASKVASGDEPVGHQEGMGVANLQGRYAIANRPEKIGGARHFGTLGFSTRAFYGQLFNYAFGLAIEVGGTYEAGLAYKADLLPLGGAVALGKRGFAMLAGGAGVSGVALETIPFAVRFPLELRLEIEPVDALRVVVGAEVAWTPFTTARREGAPRGPFADEIGFVLAMGPSRAEHRGQYAMWKGYYLGVDYRETMGTPILGMIAGFNFGSAQ